MKQILTQDILTLNLIFQKKLPFTCRFFIKAYFCWVLLNAEYNSSSESTVQLKKPQMLRCTGCHLEVPGWSWLCVFGACLREKWCSFPQKLASLVAMHIPRYPFLQKVANFAWADLAFLCGGLDVVFESFEWDSLASLSSACKLAKEDVFRDAAVQHADHMTCPAQLTADQVSIIFHLSTFLQDVSVWYEAPPLYEGTFLKQFRWNWSSCSKCTACIVSTFCSHATRWWVCQLCLDDDAIFIPRSSV